MAEKGHNSGIAVDQLRAFCERIERLQEERKAIGEDISEVRKEAKANGFDMKALNFVLSMRKKEKEELAVLSLYAEAMGVFG